MKRWGIAVFFFACSAMLSLGCLTPSAYACSRGPTSFEEDFLEAQAIFTAKVSKVEAVYPFQKAAAVEAAEAYKGQAPSFVVTNDDPDQCGASIEEGKTYLFYSRGVELPYVSVFDTHLLGSERAEELVRLLKQRTERIEPKPPGEASILAYSKGEIRMFLGKHDRGRPAEAFIANDSVYVPLSFLSDNLPYSAVWDPIAKEVSVGWTNRMELEEPEEDGRGPAAKDEPQAVDIRYDNIRVKVKDQTGKASFLDGAPEPLFIGEKLYVPLRAVAEKLGLEVEWVGNTASVILHYPFDDRTGSGVLALRYIVNVGLEGKLEVDRLTKDEIVYRAYNGHMEEGAEVKPVAVPFAEMLKMEAGYRQYTAQFYLETGNKEIRLLMSQEAAKKLENDAGFRDKVGAKLGKPLDGLPAARVLHVDDFE